MYLMGLSRYLFWRKGWDSNPRTGSSPITRFRVERVTASSLPFHKRVFYTNCRRRASLFSHCLRSGSRRERQAAAATYPKSGRPCVRMPGPDLYAVRVRRQPFSAVHRRNLYNSGLQVFLQGKRNSSRVKPEQPQSGSVLLSSMSA